ncbi:MAG: hypothetical protein ACE5J7_03775 [Candidatus Aenigmatarchaeota archaeon]
MDITKAASHGWTGDASIEMELEDLTIGMFERHSFLDKYLSEFSPITIYSKNKNRKTHMERELALYHGQREKKEDRGVSISTRPKLDEGFVDAVARKFCSKNVDYKFPLNSVRNNRFFRGSIYGDLWYGAEKVGHREAAELARFFDKEYVKRPFRTRISVRYSGLVLKHVIAMNYSPKNVLEFKIVGYK